MPDDATRKSQDATQRSRPYTASNGCPVLRGEGNPANGKDLLIKDHYLIDMLSRFNREKIPERTVHAKGAGAYGVFEVWAVSSSW